MPTSNEQYQDRIISHQIGLRRLSNATVRRVIAMLNRTRLDVQRLLSERLARIEERGFDLGPATTARLQQLDIELQGILKESHQMIVGAVNSDLEALARYEPEYQSKLLNDVLPVNLEMVRPSAQTLQAIVYSQPFQGRVLKDWTDQFVANDRRRIMDAIRMGMVEGETPTQIVRRVEGTKALRYKDGVREVSRRGLQTLVQTASSHVANRARQAWAMESGVVETEVFVATLDSKTCFVAGTLLETPHGLRPIEDILTGDMVIGGSGEPRRVLATPRSHSSDLVRVTLSNGESAICTADHLWKTDRGWVEAGSLNAGEKMKKRL